MSSKMFSTKCLYCNNDEAYEIHEDGIIQTYCQICGYQKSDISDYGYEHIRDMAYEDAENNNIPDEKQDDYVDEIIDDMVEEYLRQEVGPNKIPNEINIKKGNLIIKYLNMLKPAHPDFNRSLLTTISEIDIDADLCDIEMDDFKKIIIENLFKHE